MPDDAYLLTERQLKVIERVVHQQLRKYVNTKGLPPTDKLDHEEMTAPEVYIARTKSGGIPGLTSMGSTGIGDVPGVGDVDIFRILPTPDTTDLVGMHPKRAYNMSPLPIDGNKWVLAMRDKYGKWQALYTGISDLPYTPPVPATNYCTRGPGWVAGLTVDNCLLLTIRCSVGSCSTIDTEQSILLRSEDGEVWEGEEPFIYSGGSGSVVFIPRPSGASLPTLSIDGYGLMYDSVGVDDDGNIYIEFGAGQPLCEEPGTSSGTGTGTAGSRLECGSNTFLVRLTCVECPGTGTGTGTSTGSGAGTGSEGTGTSTGSGTGSGTGTGTGTGTDIGTGSGTGLDIFDECFAPGCGWETETLITWKFQFPTLIGESCNGYKLAGNEFWDLYWRNGGIPGEGYFETVEDFEPFTDCGNASAILECDAANSRHVLEIRLDNTTVAARYVRSFAEGWDCCGSNYMYFQSTDDACCTDWPTYIVVVAHDENGVNPLNGDCP